MELIVRHRPFGFIERMLTFVQAFRCSRKSSRQPKDAQDQLVVSQVVCSWVRNEIRTLEGKISGLQGALEKKTSLQDVENVKFADALEGLYDIARSLDTVAMTVRLRISRRV